MPEIFPYRFDQVNSSAGRAYPLCLDSTGQAAVYEVQQGNRGGHLSAIVIGYHPLDSDNRINQFNFVTPSIQSHLAADFDSDGVEEVAVSYMVGDTAMLEIVDALDIRGRICSIGVFVGPDKDGNGRWDGSCRIVGVGDVDSDGSQEILLAVGAGFDRVPRSLICWDWSLDSIIWEYGIAGLVGDHMINTVEAGDAVNQFLVFGTNAPSNGHRHSNTDDRHSYAICLDMNGNQQWIRETGGQFSTAMPRVVRLAHEAEPAVVMEVRQPDTSGQVSSRLIKCDVGTGDVIESTWLPCKLRLLEVFDLNCDGQSDIIAVTEDNQLFVYSTDLCLISAYDNARFYSLSPIGDCMEGQETMLIAGLVDGSAVLLDESMELLARSLEKGEYGTSLIDEGVTTLLTQGRRGTKYFTLHKAPWTLIFSRYPALAFLAALIPLGTMILIIWYVLAIRQKNRFIKRQQEAIDRTTTDLQKVQIKLVEAEKYKQAQSIAGGVAHEIHNALFPALASLQKLSDRMRTKKLPERRDLEMLNISREAVTRGLKMTDLVKLYSRLESEVGDNSVDLSTVVDEILTSLSLGISQSNISVDCTIPERYNIQCEQIHIASILRNLVGNALDAMQESQERLLRVSATMVGDMIELTITDSGCGMSDDELTCAFDVFFTTKPETGTGLGLPIVKKIVELYGGSIIVDSVLEKGTNITILLPKGQ